MTPKKLKNIWQAALAKVLSQRYITNLFASVVDHADLSMMNASKGSLSVTSLITGWPIIKLTTIGARSGHIRHTPLIGIPDEENIILIASNFGRPTHPAWYHNLIKHPHAKVQLNGKSGDYIAKEARGEERHLYWEMAAKVYPGFNAYARRAADRTIPVIVLHPENIPTTLEIENPPSK